MQSLPHALSAALFRVIRLLWLAWVACLLAALLVAGLVLALVGALWMLLSGRAPRAWATFSTLRQRQQQFRQRFHPGFAGGAQRTGGGSDDVVDVQARELPATRIGREAPRGGDAP